MCKDKKARLLGLGIAALGGVILLISLPGWVCWVLVALVLLGLGVVLFLKG